MAGLLLISSHPKVEVLKGLPTSPDGTQAATKSYTFLKTAKVKTVSLFVESRLY
jgi:hypothetical protein